MPFPMKVQPIDSSAFADSSTTKPPPPPPRSRLKRLFERPFTNALLKSSSEFEPSSVALDKMVRNFLEDNEKIGRYGKNRCNCFNRSSNDDSSDDEFEFDSAAESKSNFSDSSDSLKSLIPCASKAERNLLADVSKIVEKNKSVKRKDDLVKVVIENLLALSYDAALCKSKWEKTSSIPAGEYEYIDVVIDGERILIEVDFRSEFEIARSTGTYKAILQSLPLIFVGKSERLTQIIAIAAEAAKHSLKKKGMHVAPWRKAEYIRSKWLGNFKRISMNVVSVVENGDGGGVNEGGEVESVEYEGGESDSIFGEKKGGELKSGSGEKGKTMLFEYEGGELELIFGEKAKTTSLEVDCNSVAPPEKVSGEGEKLDFSVKVPWQPPEVKLNNNKAIVTGLASLLKEKF